MGTALVKQDPAEVTGELTFLQRQGAEIIALHNKPNAAVAEEVGVNVQTVKIWRRNPVFQQRVREIQDGQIAAIHETGLANKNVRISSYEDEYQRLMLVREGNASRAREAGFEGWESGYIIPETKKIGWKDFAEKLINPVFDKQLFNAFMEVKERIAKETGQWTEKSLVQQDVVIREYRGIDLSKM